MLKFYIETYGCAANKSDSEIMIGILKSKGFTLVNSPKDSDINIINTCIVKTPTANRMMYRIKDRKTAHSCRMHGKSRTKTS